jgi:hypothetical protein
LSLGHLTNWLQSTELRADVIDLTQKFPTFDFLNSIGHPYAYPADFTNNTIDIHEYITRVDNQRTSNEIAGVNDDVQYIVNNIHHHELNDCSVDPNSEHHISPILNDDFSTNNPTIIPCTSNWLQSSTNGAR